LPQKTACRMTAGWSTATGYSSNQPHQLQHLHGVTFSAVDDPWMLGLRHYQPYLYRDDTSHLSTRFPHYDIPAAAYEPPFVECSSLFTNVQQHPQQQSSRDDDVSRQLENSTSTPDFQKDVWTVRESYQSLVDHRRQQQLNYTS